MTAINALVLPDAVHLFTDGGHDDGAGRTVALASKTHFVPHVGAVFAFSGPAIMGTTCLVQIGAFSDMEGAMAALPAIARRAMDRLGGHGFTAILAGAGLGIAVEDEKVTHLLSGMAVKSIPTPLRFDADDLAGSGLAMMEDQRQRGPVAGYCQHSILTGGVFTARILRRW